MLYLSIGGAVYVSTDDKNILLAELDFPTQKARALFLYLGLTQGRRHSRRALSALFWPDADEKGAANNLRQTIHRLRTMIFEAGIDPAVIDTSAQHIALIVTPTVVIDALHIDQVWRECQTHTHRSPERCTICVRRLAQAAERISEAPLAGLMLPDSPEFELWLASRRTQIVDSSRQILLALTKFHVAGGEAVTALHYVRQWLAIEPWQEEAHALAMELLAVQGKRAAALHQFQQCRQILHDELGVEPDVELQRLNNRIAAGAQFTLPSPRLHHAPFAAIHLFGRQAEWRVLEELLNNPANRLITILGLGGAGKSQLALAAAQAVARLFPDGAYFVNLDSVRDTGHFHTLLAGALGIALGAEPTASPKLSSVESQVLSYLAHRNVLILLDSMEQLTPTTPFLATLLQRAPGVTLLVTSRVRLELRAEHVLPLEGLPVPVALAERQDDADDSLTHFVYAAQRLKPDFRLTPENADDVLRICTLVEGLPLATELAAAQLGDSSPHRLATELANSLDRISANWADMPPRQRSLRASFAASWGHLTPRLQQLLSMLSVFSGTFSVEAVVAIVADATHVSPDAVWLDNDLQQLVDLSLLRRTTGGRYALHSAVRTFALEELQKRERLAIMHNAHLRYYDSWLRMHHPSYAGAAQKAYLDKFDQETGNLWAAWRWAETTENWATLSRLASIVHAACTIRVRHEECASLLDQSIAALQARNPAATAEQNASSALIVETLVRLSILRGLTALQMSDRSLAHTHAAEAQRWLPRLKNGPDSPRRTLDAAYWHLQCKLALYEGNWTKMEIAAQHGLESLTSTGEKHLHGLLLNYAGVAAQVQGQVDRAAQAFEESIVLLAGSDGDPWSAAGSRTNLAALWIVEERAEEATRLLQESSAYFYQIGDLVSTALTLDHLASIEMTLNNNPRAAIDRCQQALSLLEQTGLPSRKAEILSTLGIIALKENDPLTAYRHSVAALHIALDINRTVDIITIGAWLSLSLLHLGQMTAPATRFLCTALNSPLFQADIRKVLETAMEGLPAPCGVSLSSSEADADFDWRQAATALLAPL